jgi:hypothetical protein
VGSTATHSVYNAIPNETNGEWANFLCPYSNDISNIYTAAELTLLVKVSNSGSILGHKE